MTERMIEVPRNCPEPDTIATLIGEVRELRLENDLLLEENVEFGLENINLRNQLKLTQSLSSLWGYTDPC